MAVLFLYQSVLNNLQEFNTTLLLIGGGPKQRWAVQTTLSAFLACLKSCVLKVKDDVLRKRHGLQEPLFSLEVGQTGILFGPGKTN